MSGGLPGIDIAWARPSVAQIKAVGAQWVARYLSPDKTKNLRYDEIASYAAAGLGTVTVWESSAGRALQGFAAGKADAQAAEVQRKALGLPGDHVHHFAVDTDTDWPSVLPYFQGVASVLPQARVGVYGGIKVIRGAYAAGYRFLWQTVAWSANVWHPKATIRQTGGTVLGGDADRDVAMFADFGQFPRPVQPAPAPPAPPPTPAPVHPFKEIQMIMVAPHEDQVPDGTPWPGIFLLNGGHLNHVATPADVTAFKQAGVPGPAAISWLQFQGLKAGN